jgi:hypothetical protein
VVHALERLQNQGDDYVRKKYLFHLAKIKRFKNIFCFPCGKFNVFYPRTATLPHSERNASEKTCVPMVNASEKEL